MCTDSPSTPSLFTSCRTWVCSPHFCSLRELKTRVVHDFRRTAVRALERADVPRSGAMKMTGNKTECVYHRYAIVSESDLKEAAMKLTKISDAAGTKTDTLAAATGSATISVPRK